MTAFIALSAFMLLGCLGLLWADLVEPLSRPVFVFLGFGADE